MKPTKRSRVARQRTRQLGDVLANVQVPQRPRNGWIDAIREALGMTKTQLAKRMAIARPSLNRLESNEVKGAITLASLRNAADALGCDLQYVLVPRQPLEKIVAEQARRRANQKLGRINQSQALEASAIDTGSLSDAISDLAKELEIQRPTEIWND